MKKLLCAMLCAVLTLTFVACGWDNGNGGNGGSGGNTSGGDDVYVKVIDKGLGSKWIENIASAYYEETGIKVHVSSDPELVSNLLTLMNNPGSEKEDLYFVGHTMNNWIKWIRNGAIESIDDVLSSTKYGTSAKSRVVDKYIVDMGTYNYIPSGKNFLGHLKKDMFTYDAYKNTKKDYENFINGEGVY